MRVGFFVKVDYLLCNDYRMYAYNEGDVIHYGTAGEEGTIYSTFVIQGDDGEFYEEHVEECVPI